ncbi:MAG: DUF2163 domain-containing protein [Hyphomonadaceae bacterium]|nr:DUF2163 domain-containing protein [Hyphomonadaceae bacterium]
MKQVGDVFAARLAASDTSFCVCWRLLRDDGAVFGETDHDAMLTIDGVEYRPSAGLQHTTFDSSSGLAPGRAAAKGALSLDFLSEGDLDAGLWNGARVDVWRVDWRAVEHRIPVWSGKLSEVTRQGRAFAAELISLKADLERVIGRVYHRDCDADVGDPRCGKDLGVAGFHADGVVADVSGPRSFHATGLDGFAPGWFAGGTLVWESGGNAGALVRVERHDGAGTWLAVPARVIIEPGDTFRVFAGCDKSFGMCGGKFGNRINFRGFPHMPGPDAVLAGPASNRANIGGKRP